MNLALPTIYWESTSQCNLACPGCMRSTGNGELSTGEVFRLLEDSIELGTLYMVVGGGEPFLRKDIMEILSYAAELGMNIEVITRGTMLTPDLVRKLEKARVDSIMINLDHADADMFDRYSGRQGAFAQIINGLDILRDSPLVTGISAWITPSNLSEIDRLMNLGLEKEVDYIRFSPITGCSAMPKQPMQLSQDWIGITTAILDAAEKYIDCFIYKDYEIIPAARSVSNYFALACPAGSNMMAITPDGNIKGCAFLPQENENLRSNNIINIWNGGFADFRKVQCNKLGGKCHNCGLIECRGGCIAERIARGGLQGEQEICIDEILSRALSGRNTYDIRMVTSGWLGMARMKKTGCVAHLPIWTYFLRNTKRRLRGK